MAKLKGTALVLAVKLIRKNREQIEPLLDDATRAFVSQRILPGSWYPIEDATRLLMAACRFFGGTPEETMEMFGMYCAEMDLSGVYAHVICPGDPARTFRRATMLYRNYVDSGTLSLIRMDTGLKRYSMRLEGLQQTGVPLCAVIPGMSRVIARFVGVEKSYKIHETRCMLRGGRCCEFDSSWG